MHKFIVASLHVGLVCAATVVISPKAEAQQFNYFGDCNTDQMIYAKNGKWYYDNGYGTGTIEMTYGGTYRTLSKKIIVIDTGQQFKHISLLKITCG